MPTPEQLEFIIEAAKQGDINAQVTLGKYYEDKAALMTAEESINWYRQQAFKWYKQAAEQGIDGLHSLATKGHEGAQFALGEYYGQQKCGFTKGTDEPFNWYREQTFKWYNLAAGQGNPDAQVALGEYCERMAISMRDVEASFSWYKDEAFKWHRQAAEQANKGGIDGLHRLATTGHAGAQCDLGHHYQRGIGVKQDLKEAVRLWTLAAEQGYVMAQWNLGFCYLHGAGVEKNEQEALKLWTLAAKGGYAAAQNKLGICYQYGDGVAKDEMEAMRWYRLAAKQEHQKTQSNLEQLSRRDENKAPLRNEEECKIAAVANAAHGHARTVSGESWVARTSPASSSSKNANVSCKN
jgi:uncharacterized protein